MAKTQLKPKIEAEVDGLGKVYRIEAPFDQAVEALTSIDAHVINARDLAYARITEGAQSTLSSYGGYIQEGNICIPKEKGIILVRKSLILQSQETARQAVQFHRNGKEFPIEKKLASEYLDKAKSESNEAFLLTNRESIPTNRFGEDERTLWLFQDKAQEYGEFLKEYKITEMPLWFDSQEYINNQESPYANQLWLRDLDGRSGLGGSGRYVSYYYRVRGVSETGEASAQKTLKQAGTEKAYTPKRLIATLKRLEIKGLEKSILEDLRRNN